MVRFWAYFEKWVNCTCQHVTKTRKGKDQNENLELTFITMINCEKGRQAWVGHRGAVAIKTHFWTCLP